MEAKGCNCKQMLTLWKRTTMPVVSEASPRMCLLTIVVITSIIYGVKPGGAP